MTHEPSELRNSPAWRDRILFAVQQEVVWLRCELNCPRWCKCVEHDLALKCVVDCHRLGNWQALCLLVKQGTQLSI
jgi:hypothetical protein